MESIPSNLNSDFSIAKVNTKETLLTGIFMCREYIILSQVAINLNFSLLFFSLADRDCSRDRNCNHGYCGRYTHYDVEGWVCRCHYGWKGDRCNIGELYNCSSISSLDIVFSIEFT